MKKLLWSDVKLAQVCSEMIPNKLKQLWSQGKPTINGWCSIGNPFTAEIMAAQGNDSITIDVQHGALDCSSALPMLQAMRASGVIPMARVPWMEPGIIMKVLDAGAYGVICPMVNNAIPVSTKSMSGPLTSPLGWRKAASPRASTARSPR
jgi:4-hydroxy-2-oxoheptanedioate aldolase